MEYDPIKDKLGSFFRKSPALQVLFFKLLDLLLLRAWHIHKEIRDWAATRSGRQHLLDAGTGFGQYSYWILNNYSSWSVEGVDVNPTQIGSSNTLFRKLGFENAHFKVADLTRYKNPETYDLAVCVDVMEHILEDVAVFRNVYASLKPGGMMLISTPSDQGGSGVQTDSDESFIGEHVRDGYNVNELKEKLETGGFERVEVRYQYGTPGQISWKLSMKYPMQMLNTSFLFIVILPFWYLLFFPFCLLLNYRDTYSTHRTGTGLIAKAYKEPE
ncbi:MAG: class I SAM-dependent methyltransferase [Bacteroidia bacterium]